MQLLAHLGCKGPLAYTDQRQLSLSRPRAQGHHLWPIGVVDDLVVGPVDRPTCPRGSAVVGAVKRERGDIWKFGPRLRETLDWR